MLQRNASSQWYEINFFLLIETGKKKNHEYDKYI